MENTTEKYVYIKNYGCQMNVYDGDKIVDLLKPHGYKVTDSPENADVAILNTCHIREKAEHKVFSDIGRLNKIKRIRRVNNLDLKIAVGGCVGQAQGKEIMTQAPAVSLVFGPQSLHRLPEMLKKISHENGPKRAVDTEFPTDSKFDHLPKSDNAKISAFLSIQEGCDKFCNFCVVPYTRGAEYSRPIEQIVSEAKHLISLGAVEITLLGQNVNGYHGNDKFGKAADLGKLLFALAKVDGLKRLRYTTSHPNDMHDSLYDAHRDIDILMPLLHLPVQSGSDSILKAMNRKHTVKDYLNIIERLHKNQPKIAFSSDFIIGYPGESDKDFQETLALVHEVNFILGYSFNYSPRPGTPASILAYQVDEKVKNERLQVLQALLSHQQHTFNQSFEQKKISVLIDRKSKEGKLMGKSEHLQSVHIKTEKSLDFGNICDIIIDKGAPNSLNGVLN